MLIKYGIQNNNIDVTEYCYENLVVNDILIIPASDPDRADHFGDPLMGILKSIFVITDLGIVVEYNDKKIVTIDPIKNVIINDLPVHLIPPIPKKPFNILTNCNPNQISDVCVEERLRRIHRSLTIEYGHFNDEYPEQLMVSRYLKGDEKVLEIGANIGRNTLVIAQILRENNNNNFVTMESSTDIAKLLEINKNANNFEFHIECSALSKRPLIQKGWETFVSDTLLDGYHSVNTINLEELNLKYKIEFDTLILDCEGAFYYILTDMPEILKNVNLVIMENDYNDINHKNCVDDVLKQNNFVRDYVRNGGWGPCAENFFEVWKRRT